MAKQASHLSRYGYDFVVATTQASIESDLKLYLSQGTNPEAYYCFLADPNTGYPSKEISLENLLQATNGVNPFDIPDGTPYNDPRITTLTKNLFAVGIKIQIGLPPGVPPSNYQVVKLNESADNVTFNLYCSELTVVQNSPPSGFGGNGKWNIWAQPSGNPWYMSMKVDLVMEDLSRELDTQYFRNNPLVQTQLRKHLEKNLSGSAFSLQQLIYDLDNAAFQTVPSFVGIPDNSGVIPVLQQSFLDVHQVAAKKQGLPLVSVTVVPETQDPSSLQMTGFERQVSPFKGEKGDINPSVTTLDYLCMSSNHPQPPASAFTWNWVQPKDRDNISGAIAVNRNTMAQYFLGKIQPFVSQSCLQFTCHVSINHKTLAPNYGWSQSSQAGVPQVSTITTENFRDNVIQIRYTSSASDNDEFDNSVDGYSATITAALTIEPSYTCDVYFAGDTMRIHQRLCVQIYAEHNGGSDSIRGYDTTIDDTYTISASQFGVLEMTQTDHSMKDDSQKADSSAIANFFTGINNLVTAIKNKIGARVAPDLREVPCSNLNNFVFPGAKVFTYQSVTFSDFQDLVADIIYVAPEETITFLKEKSSSTAAALASPNPSLDLNYSSELLQNYVQGEIVCHSGKFQCLQDGQGLALLFTISSSAVFNVIQEKSGTTSTGWQTYDLSTAAMKAHRLGNAETTVRTFDVAQSAVDSRINLAMVLSSSDSSVKDHLLVSLNNDSSDISWLDKLKWTSIPFDAELETKQAVNIMGTLFAETTSCQQYLIVDIDRSDRPAVRDIARYYIDPCKSTGSYWVKHDLPVDIEDSMYQSCVGRVSNGYVDGVYTSGTAGGAPQLIYVPIINVFGEGPPAPIRLSLPGQTVPSAIAAARNRDNSSSQFATTDLYAVSSSTLYRFAANAQKDNAVAQPLVSNDLFSGTEALFATTQDGLTTIWGKNGSNQVYTLSCSIAQLDLPGSWSTPVPILVGVESISTYVNWADRGNTIFAAGGGKLQKLTQATATAAKVWRSQDINVSSSAQQKLLSFKSYTTTLLFSEANVPAAGVAIAITTDSRTSVYMNGLYYVLSETPVNILTDATGSITVIEATEDINAAILTVSTDGGVTRTAINPMDIAFNKLKMLTSEDSLRSANFPAETTAGGVIGITSSTPLIPRSTNRDDIRALASSIDKLSSVYSNTSKRAGPIAMAMPVIPSTLFGTGSDIAIAFGDLFRWLKSGIMAVIEIVEDIASNVWHFVAVIAGKAYRAVLDTVDAIVGAVECIFRAIGTEIEDLIHYVEFLFSWDDIKLTKNIFHNMAKRYIEHQVDEIETWRADFDEQITSLEQAINTLTGVTDWSSLGALSSKTAAGNGSNPGKGHNSGSLLFAHHFRDQAKNLTVTGEEPSVSILQNLIDNLLSAIDNEGEVLSDIYLKLKKLASKFNSLSLGDVIKILAGILATGMLSSVQIVVDALLDVLHSVAAYAVGLFDTKIHIPIISDILESIGVPEISLLDLLTWIAAVGYTVFYKLATKAAPFTNDEYSKAVISATTWSDLSALFNHASELSPQKLNAGGLNPPSVLGATNRKFTVSLPEDLVTAIFVAGHGCGGFMFFCNNFIQVPEAEAETGNNPYSILSTVMGVFAACLVGGVNILVPKDAIKSKSASIAFKVTTAITVTNMVIFSQKMQALLRSGGSRFSGLAVGDGRAVGGVIDAILVMPALIISLWHFYELSEEPDDPERTAAILNESSYVAWYMSRVSYAAAVNDKDLKSRQLFIGGMVISNTICAGLQTAEACIH